MKNESPSGNGSSDVAFTVVLICIAVISALCGAAIIPQIEVAAVKADRPSFVCSHLPVRDPSPFVIASGEPSVGGASGFSCPGCRVMTGTTLEEIQAIMKSEGYETIIYDMEDIEDGIRTLLWILDSGTPSIFVDDSPQRVTVMSIWTEPAPPGLEEINSWNRFSTFSYAYLDRQGNPIFKAMLDLAGGVCEDRVRDFLRLCRERYSDWKGRQTP